MKRLALAVVALAALASPARAQNYPMTDGNYVEIAQISIDDGHTMDYAMFLAGQWKAQQEFAKSQGWITGYEVLQNINKRPGEPDIYLITRYKSLPDAAESTKRQQMFRDHFKKTDTDMDAGSAERSKFRHVMGSMLLQEAIIK